LCLVGARLRLRFLPFSRIGKRLGRFVAPDDPGVAARRSAADHAQRRLAHQVGWAVSATASTAPLRSVCLPQAMAAKVMLDRRGIASIVHFGMAPGDPRREGHVWLEAAGIGITGYPVDPAQVELGCFV
jgi:hypothetical protein